MPSIKDWDDEDDDDDDRTPVFKGSRDYESPVAATADSFGDAMATFQTATSNLGDNIRKGAISSMDALGDEWQKAVAKLKGDGEDLDITTASDATTASNATVGARREMNDAQIHAFASLVGMGFDDEQVAKVVESLDIGPDCDAQSALEMATNLLLEAQDSRSANGPTSQPAEDTHAQAPADVPPTNTDSSSVPASAPLTSEQLGPPLTLPPPKPPTPPTPPPPSCPVADAPPLPPTLAPPPVPHNAAQPRQLKDLIDVSGAEALVPPRSAAPAIEAAPSAPPAAPPSEEDGTTDNSRPVASGRVTPPTCTASAAVPAAGTGTPASSVDAPAVLPSGWYACVDSTGRPYWFDTNTNTSQWTPPPRAVSSHPDDAHGATAFAATPANHATTLALATAVTSVSDAPFGAFGTEPSALSDPAAAAAEALPSLPPEGRMGALPAGWHACYDGTHQLPYYYNTVTKQSQWTFPTAAAAVPLPALPTLCMKRQPASLASIVALGDEFGGVGSMAAKMGLRAKHLDMSLAAPPARSLN